jgi:hypothetical protein
VGGALKAARLAKPWKAPILDERSTGHDGLFPRHRRGEIVAVFNFPIKC